jgi:hypothetical protein
MTETKKPKKRWRWLKRGLFAIAMLITLLAVAIVFENWRGRRAWANYRAELEANGEVLDWRTLIPQNIPDDQNFAKTPLLAPLMDYHRDPNTGEPVFADPDAKERITSMFAWGQQLKTAYWRQGRKTDWAKIQSELRSQTNSSLPAIQALLKRPPGTPQDDVLFLFSHNKAELDEISAAAKRPFSSFDTQFDEGFYALMPQLMVIRSLTRGFTLKPLAELAATNTAAALADWQTSVALGKALDGDPVLISLLVKVAVIDSTLNVVWEGLAQHRWDDRQLTQIQATLDNLNFVADAKQAFQGERAYALVALDQLLGEKGAGATMPGAMFRRFLFPGWVAQNKVYICRMYTDHLLTLLDPKNNRIKIAEVAASDEKIASELKGNNPYRMMAKQLFPAVSKVLLRIANAQTAIDLATVACALERYQLANGTYPTALGALVPQFVDSIPLDLDGQPLRYQLETDGLFVLYSIGTDLKDDQGAPTVSSPGDWVWKYSEAQKPE